MRGGGPKGEDKILYFMFCVGIVLPHYLKFNMLLAYVFLKFINF